MAENLYVKKHRFSNKKWRDNWDETFGNDEDINFPLTGPKAMKEFRKKRPGDIVGHYYKEVK